MSINHHHRFFKTIYCISVGIFLLLSFIATADNVAIDSLKNETFKLDQGFMLIAPEVVELIELSQSELSKIKPSKTEEKLAKVSNSKKLFNAGERYLILLSQARAAQKNNQHLEVIDLLAQAKSFAANIPEAQLSTPYFSTLYLTLAKSYVALNQYENALKQRAIYLEKYKAHMIQAKQNTIDLLNEKYNNERKENENLKIKNMNKVKQSLIAEAEKNSAQQQSYLYIVLIAVVLFSLLIWKKIKIRKALQQLAKTDSLTGILNRNTLFEYGEVCLTHAIVNNEDLSVVLFDIDHFKAINDNYGHDIGEEVIKIVAQLGNEVIDNGDLFARINGDEFVIFLPHKNNVEGELLAEQLREKINELDFNYLGISHTITVSLGVVSRYQVEPWLDDLLHCADQAMCSAKSKGRNQTIVYDEKLETIGDSPEAKQ